MLKDISNSYTSSCLGSNNASTLKTLKIVKNNATITHANNGTYNKHRKYTSSVNANNNMESKENINTANPATPKMLEVPNYKFKQIYFPDLFCDSEPFFPFYQTYLVTDNVYNKNDNELKLDFTKDINFGKNNIKKYSNLITLPNLTVDIPVNIFSPKIEKKIDPINACFNNHNIDDNQLRFGNYLLKINKSGIPSMCFKLPSTDEILNLKKQTEDFYKQKIEKEEQAADGDDDEEELYKSDENDSRLDNSDSDFEFSEEDDDEDNDAILNTDSIHSDLINSSLVSQGIPPCSIESLHLINNPIRNNVSSPVKNINYTANTNIFRNYSPTKNLQNQRIGLIKKPKITSPKKTKTKNSNYSKFDNSMTISAKGIMKMVDDSLVSSDTELHSSFSFMRNTSNCVRSINALDLLNALKDDDYLDESNPFALSNKFQNLAI